MYAVLTRRTVNRERQPETMQRADREFFPKLQQALGFVGFYLVAGQDEVTTAVLVWEDRAAAEAFRPEAEQWSRTLEQLGNRLESVTGGEVLRQVMPSR